MNTQRFFSAMAVGMMLGGVAFTSCSSTPSLSREESDAQAQAILDARKDSLRQVLAQEWQNHEFTNGDYRMKFWDTIYGPTEAPQGGRSLYISLHGGGGAPPEVNDQQWDNQKVLYAPAEGKRPHVKDPGADLQEGHQLAVRTVRSRDQPIRLAIERKEGANVAVLRNGLLDHLEALRPFVPKFREHDQNPAILKASSHVSSEMLIASTPFSWRAITFAMAR